PGQARQRPRCGLFGLLVQGAGLVEPVVAVATALCRADGQTQRLRVAAVAQSAQLAAEPRLLVVQPADRLACVAPPVLVPSMMLRERADDGRFVGAEAQALGRVGIVGPAQLAQQATRLVLVLGQEMLEPAAVRAGFLFGSEALEQSLDFTGCVEQRC